MAGKRVKRRGLELYQVTSGRWHVWQLGDDDATRMRHVADLVRVPGGGWRSVPWASMRRAGRKAYAQPTAAAHRFGRVVKVVPLPTDATAAQKAAGGHAQGAQGNGPAQAERASQAATGPATQAVKPDKASGLAGALGARLRMAQDALSGAQSAVLVAAADYTELCWLHQQLAYKLAGGDARHYVTHKDMLEVMQRDLRAMQNSVAIIAGAVDEALAGL